MNGASISLPQRAACVLSHKCSLLMLLLHNNGPAMRGRLLLLGGWERTTVERRKE